MIGGVDYLSHLPHSVKEDIHYRLTLENFEKEAYVFQQDAKCTELYFLVSGDLELVV